uniref:Glycoside hydrolase n=1 Tax=Chloropicon primus TaxID=1764295 RepID=A0A7S2SZ41_9CHLO|mmetsp:Transcript_12359/g.34395  ORF Transcript_12359/g.34395 Transcript_12359/m.34395 type:complete len:688 (+) Transcript_12359:845-2908(+)
MRRTRTRTTLGLPSLSSSSSWLWGSSGPADVPPQVDLESWNSTRFAAPLLTEWGEALSPGDVSSVEHHPRPQLQRPGEWVNLNGFWDFRVEDATHGAGVPSSRGFEGKILVPFAIESALSGVARDVSTEKQLVYRRHLELPESSLGGGKRHILHFGAVDWKAWVYINDELVGTHEGGFDPFHFDVTGHLRGGARNGGGKHELKVVAWDPTEDGPQPHGKQWRDKGSDRLIAPEGMWYTSVTGIWQTVWLEAVPEKFYIESVHLTPSIKSRSVRAKVETVAPGGGMPYVKMTAYDEHGIVGFGSGWSGDEVALKFNENHIPRLWSPDSPFLYNLTVSLHLSGRGEIVDQVESYFAMREVSLGRAGEAVQFHLNGEPLFQYGVLDQGWWPDGLYTPPSEDALAFDILKAKEFGFNLIRKHAKVESDRFYHLCDRLGMLVWQDMPSSTGIYMWSPDGAHDFVEGDKVPEAASGFLAELRGVMHSLYSHPSVVGWIPFNEGWGQFDTVDIFAWMQRYDPQRLVWVSGGNDFGIGAAFDRHVYPGPSFVRLEECRASVLGEFGGNGFAIPEHSWRSSADEGGAGGDNYDTFLDWGYAQVRTLKELEGHYQRQMTVLDGLVKQGLSAAIFTQLTDVESESNGLMTYDRKVMKLDPEVMKSFHGALYRSGSEAKQGLHEFGLHPSEGSKCPWEE